MRGMDLLLELQGLDLALGRLEVRKRDLEGGESLQAARREMELAESRLGELGLALDAVGHEQLRLEHEIDGLTQKASAEEKRLYDGSVANAKELEALQAEVANLKARTRRLEDELLEQMLRREELETRQLMAKEEADIARARAEEIGGDRVRELSEVERELAERTSARAALVPEIDDELLELYESLRTHKDGVGVAALVDGVCQGCHQKLSALELDRLKKEGGVKRCEYCRRILIAV